MATKTDGGDTRFRLSRDDTPIGELVKRRRRHGPFRLEDVIVGDDTLTRYWLDVLQVAHRHGGFGQGLGVVIIDSGIDDDAGISMIDRERSLDLTGEGLGKGASHGTAISLLYEIVAPKLKQFHIKLFRSNGDIRGASYSEKINFIEKAFGHAAQLQAQIANISWNVPTVWHKDSLTNSRVYDFCRCRLCEVTASFARNTGINVFVSEGNFFSEDDKAREERGDRLPAGFYSCPAAASQVIPVLAFANGRPRYRSNLLTDYALPGPAAVGLRREQSLLSLLSAMMHRPAPQFMIGSSFSTPLIAGSFAALLSAFREHGLDDKLIVPKNPEDADAVERLSEYGANTYRSTYNFPLNLFIQPPTVSSYEGPEELELAEWKILYNLCVKKATDLHSKGDYHAAGRLCCLTANLMLVAFRRMEKQTDTTLVGKLTVDLYMRGISSLYQYREPPLEDFLKSAGGYMTHGSPDPLSFASAHFEPVAEALRLLRQRGAALTKAEDDLINWGAFDIAIPSGWVSELLGRDGN
jgi:hypothetical protein